MAQKQRKPICTTPDCEGEGFALSPICMECFKALPVEDRTPPVPAATDVRSLEYMPVDIRRLTASKMLAKVTPEQGWYGFRLWIAAWLEIPASSLPDDEDELAFMSGVGRDTKTWKRVREGALRGFIKCSDGRLYHLVLADKALHAWDLKRGRQRGANLTNTKGRNGQALGNEQNGQRSADRSIYKERDGERTLSGDGAARSASAHAVATERSRVEDSLQHSSSSDTARDALPTDPAALARIRIEVGQELVTACGYEAHEVMEFSTVGSWLNAGLTPDEIRGAIPVIAERIKGLKDKPKSLLRYIDPILKTEVRNMRAGIGEAAPRASANVTSSSAPPWRNRYRYSLENPGKWDSVRWGSIDQVPAHIRAEEDAAFAARKGSTAA